MIKLILLDIDGTMIHAKGAGGLAFGRAFGSMFNLPDGAKAAIRWAHSRSFAAARIHGNARHFLHRARLKGISLLSMRTGWLKCFLNLKETFSPECEI